jgi:hypothetical protein
MVVDLEILRIIFSSFTLSHVTASIIPFFKKMELNIVIFPSSFSKGTGVAKGGFIRYSKNNLP